MPTNTYYNLSKDKKERIFNAGVLEFSYHELFDASVNTIVRIANISKGSFYQYFEDKNDFYWFIILEIIFGQLTTYEEMLQENEGDFLLTEEQLFDGLLTLFDDTKYRNLLSNVYKNSYMELKSKLSSKGSTIYIDMYDTLMSFGFKGYNIKTKEDFLIAFEMVRNISNHTIMTMITDQLSKLETKQLFNAQLALLTNGLKKRGWF
jgi:AcrR family transcriptional regulator